MSTSAKKGIQAMTKEIQNTLKQGQGVAKSDNNNVARMYNMIVADKEDNESIFQSRAIIFKSKNSEIIDRKVAFSRDRLAGWVLSVKDSKPDSWREKFITLLDQDGKEPIVRTVPLTASKLLLEGFGTPGETVEDSGYFAFFGYGAPKELVELNKKNSIDLLADQEEFCKEWEHVDYIIFLLLWDDPTIQVGLKAKIKADSLTQVVKNLLKNKFIQKNNEVAMRNALSKGVYDPKCGLTREKFDIELQDYELTAFESFRNDSNSVHGFTMGEDRTNPNIKTPTWIVNVPVWKMKWQNAEMLKKKEEEAANPNKGEEDKDEESLVSKLKPAVPKKTAQEEKKTKGKGEGKKEKLALSDDQKREAMKKYMGGDTYIKNTFTFIGPDGKEIPKSDDPIKTNLRNGAVLDAFMKPLVFSNGTKTADSNTKKDAQDAKAGGKFGYKITFPKLICNLYCNGPEKIDNTGSVRTKYVTEPGVGYTEGEIEKMNQGAPSNPGEEDEIDRIVGDGGNLPLIEQEHHNTGVTKAGKKLTLAQDTDVLMESEDGDEKELREEQEREEAERLKAEESNQKKRKQPDVVKKTKGNTKTQKGKKAKSEVEEVVVEPEAIMDDQENAQED